MKYAHHTEQKDLNARAFTLRNLSAQFLEQSFYVRPSNIGRDRPSVDQFDSALMFAFHGLIVSKYSIGNKRKHLASNRHQGHYPPFSTSRLIFSAGTRDPQQGQDSSTPLASSRLIAA